MITTDIAELQALPEAQSAGLDELNEAGLLILRLYLPLHLWSYLRDHRRPGLIRLATKSLRTVWTTRLTPSGTLSVLLPLRPSCRTSTGRSRTGPSGAGRAVPVPPMLADPVPRFRP